MESLRIYNTLARDKQTFVPLQPGVVRMYVCGMTVYDYCHVGHARVMVVFDIVQRWLRTLGYGVTYVRNITDIDDKIIRRAVENGETIKSLTDRFIAALHEDADALGIERPDHEPRATEFIPQMLGMIEMLEANGYAYQGADGDVNYAVRRFAHYGALSGKSIEDLRAGERVAANDAKQDPLDFVLWKQAKAGEPAATRVTTAPALALSPSSWAMRGVTSWVSTPRLPRLTLPLVTSCCITSLLRLVGMAKPMPTEPPDGEKMAVLMPTRRP